MSLEMEKSVKSYLQKQTTNPVTSEFLKKRKESESIGNHVPKLSFETSKPEIEEKRWACQSKPLESIIEDLRIEICIWLGTNDRRKKNNTALRQNLFCAALAVMIVCGLTISESIRQSKQEYRAAMNFRIQKVIRKAAAKELVANATRSENKPNKPES